MGRQWIRKVRLTADTGNGTLDLSEMRITFQVEEWITGSPNNAKINIYNLSKATEKKLGEMKEGARIVLEAGYEDNCGPIFEGNLSKLGVIIGKENPTDSFVRLVAISGDQGMLKAKVSKTLAAGATPKDVLDEAVKAMKPYGIKQGILPKGLHESFRYPRPFMMFGMARDYLRYLDNTFHTLTSINRTELQIIKHTGPEETGDTIVLNSRTGMIGRPVQEMGVGIKARALINPDFQYNRYFKIDQASIDRGDPYINYEDSVKNYGTDYVPAIDADGIYWCRRIIWTGDTHGQPWYADLDLHAASAPATIAQTQAVGVMPNQQPATRGST